MENEINKKEYEAFLNFCLKKRKELENAEVECLNTDFLITSRVKIKPNWKYGADFYTEYEKDGIQKIRMQIIHDGKEKMWYLNAKNPIVKELIWFFCNASCPEKEIEIIKTGKDKNTRYSILPN